MTMKAMHVKEVARKVIEKENLFILDVRNEDDFADWKIEGENFDYFNIPYFELLDGVEDMIDKIPTNIEVLVVCAKEGSSKMVAEMLSAEGVEVSYLVGGMKAWSEYLEPVKVGDLKGGGELFQFVRLGKGCLSYMVVSSGEAAIIDAVRMADVYMKFAKQVNATITHVFDTHLHADHISGGRKIAKAIGAQAQLLINEGVDVLVVVPTDADEAGEIVTLAHDAGVQVISYDRLIRGADVDYYISFDNVKVGELQAEEIMSHVKEGEFAYVGGAESDNNAILFREGAKNVLEPYIESGSIDLVYDNYTTGWDPAVARDELASFLDSNDVNLDAVVAANDGTAGGVIEALGDQAGEVAVSGQDAELEGVRRVVEGTQTMTVFKSIDLIAERAANLAMDVAAGEEIETDTTIDNGQGDIPTTLLEPIDVTEENIEETIIEEGYLTESEIYGN